MMNHGSDHAQPMTLLELVREGVAEVGLMQCGGRVDLVIRRRGCTPSKELRFRIPLALNIALVEAGDKCGFVCCSSDELFDLISYLRQVPDEWRP